MRSVNEPRVAHDATVEIGEGHRARAVNLSTGGIFVTADEPLDPGAQVHLKVNLRDGATPLDVDAQVLRNAEGGMALQFVELDDVARRRIQRLVQKREPTQFGKRDVRIHLPSLPAPLRASARDLTERGVMIEAELPWLRLGSQVTTELSSDRAGLLAVQDPHAAMRMHLKMAGGGDMKQMDLNEFLVQAREYEEAGGALDRIFQILNTLERTHPFNTLRAAELQRWIEAGHYERILNGEYTRRGPDEAKRPLNKDIDEATDHYMKEAKGVVNDVVDSAKRAAQAFSDAFKKR